MCQQRDPPKGKQMRNSVRPMSSRQDPKPAWSPLLLLSGSVAAAVLLIGTSLSVAGEWAEPAGEEPLAGARPAADPRLPAAPAAEPLRLATATPLR
jgi:hypothetical protein